jgi:RimJ/RimL family protein N-acetyltransferase
MARKTMPSSPCAAPALETQRLRLRELEPSDLDALHALWCEPKVYEFIAGKPALREDSWGGILRFNGHWKLLGYGFWAVEEKTSGKLIGQMGFADFKRDIMPSLEGIPELGWVLTASARGRGYATEALTEIIAWGDKNLAQKKTACIIAPENTASIRVAEKIGFIETARTTYKDEPTILYHRSC